MKNIGRIILLIALTSAIFVAAQTVQIKIVKRNPDPVVAAQSNPQPQNKLTVALNMYRVENGLEPVEVDPELIKTAQLKADEMCSLDYFSHERPGNRPFQTIADGIREYKSFGENLARGYDTYETTIQAWKDSPAHNKNMLDNWQYVGIATNDCNGKFYAVQHFANFQ